MNKYTIHLNDRILCDYELLVNGGFYPLENFMNINDYQSCLYQMKLENGEIFPLPIVLPITIKQMNEIKKNNIKEVVLKDKFDFPLTTMTVGDMFIPDLTKECFHAYGTTDTNHPYVKIIMERNEQVYLSGKFINPQLPKHFDFQQERLTPKQTKEFIKKNNWTNIVGFQTRNPMHKSHFELTKYALKMAGENSKLLLNPVVGITQPCDVNYHTRVNCYKKLMKYYNDNAKLVLLPLSMRMAGPREAVLHALVRKNYGCDYFVVGRDHAGPSYKGKDGKNFYGPYEAQDLLNSVKDKLGIKVITSKWIVYAENKKNQFDGFYCSIDDVPETHNSKFISGTEQRSLLEKGLSIPEWFSFPEIVEELRKDYVSINKRGLCFYFVGLSGSGKTTHAYALMEKLRELYPYRKITYLDGDIIRKHLSKGLGFSKNDRSDNVRRIGYVASEIVRHNGICVVANIAPYKKDRDYNKELINGNCSNSYIEVFVNTKLSICEKRDPKGLYKLCREGKIKNFTGIDDPFEKPTNSSITLDGDYNLENNVKIIVEYLKQKNYL